MITPLRFLKEIFIYSQKTIERAKEGISFYGIEGGLCRVEVWWERYTGIITVVAGFEGDDPFLDYEVIYLISQFLISSGGRVKPRYNDTN